MSDSSLKKGRFTKFSNRIGLYSNQTGNYIANTPEVVLNFPFKDTVLEGGMTKEDSGRDERFLHLEIDKKDIDTLEDPKVLANFKYIDENGETELTADSDIEFFDEKGELKQNLLIKGNNLLALYSLREKLAGKIKLIYIDPPYNTGSDGFKYNDNFGHSSWLTFMKNRLEVARELLRSDGFIFIQCDDNEQAYLKVLMDEIFGSDNFINTIAVRVSPPNGLKISHANKRILKEKEYIHVYSKSVDVSINPQYIPLQRYDTHYNKFIIKNSTDMESWTMIPLSDKLAELGIPQDLNNRDFLSWIIQNANNVCQLVSPPDFIKNKSEYKAETFKPVVGHDGYIAYGGKQVQLLSTTVKDTTDGKRLSQIACDLWTDIGFNNLFNEGGVDLKGGKKPEKLLSRIIEMTTSEGDIILDFCLGSGTTVAVAHKMKRRWIGVEQMDYIETLAKKRLKNVIDGDTSGISTVYGWQGGGSFVYMELKKYNQDFLDRLMEVTSIPDVEAVYEDMQKNAFLKFFFDKKEFEKDENFRSKSWEERRDMLVEILDENQLYLNLQDMRDSKHKVSNDEMVLTDRFYGVNEDAES